MRTILALATAATALALAGCDSNTGTPATRVVGCNCPAPAVMPAPDMRGSTAPALPHHRRHRGYARWSGHSYYWRRSFAEVSVETYDYHSGSHSYFVGGGYGGAYAGGDAHRGGWQDGYGRWHGTGGGAGAAPDERAEADARMKPWHGYDAKCPDRR